MGNNNRNLVLRQVLNGVPQRRHEIGGDLPILQGWTMNGRNRLDQKSTGVHQHRQNLGWTLPTLPDWTMHGRNLLGLYPTEAGPIEATDQGQEVIRCQVHEVSTAPARPERSICKAIRSMKIAAAGPPRATALYVPNQRDGHPPLNLNGWNLLSRRPSLRASHASREAFRFSLKTKSEIPCLFG